MGIYFFPRGGSAHVCRALAREFERNEFELTLLSGSRSDLGEHARASSFYSGLDLRSVDFTPALRSPDRLGFQPGAGTAPMHGSYEDRPGADDPILAAIGEVPFEIQVDAWSREMELAGADEADLFYLHHLTPLNEAAARAFPRTPVLGHVHGTELLMLEQIAAGAPAGWSYAAAWAERIREWAAACERIVVSSAKGAERAAAVLELEPERFAVVPNGFDSRFAPRQVDRRAHWRRHLVERPQGWRPGSGPGSVAYERADLEPLAGTVLLYSGRFTEVKRLPLLIEAYAHARTRFTRTAPLVLVGGYPGECEGEHPADTIRRLGADDVFLAGWHDHAELPEILAAGAAIVLPSVGEQFGQVLVEGMATGLPAIAADDSGPSEIVRDGETGWLVKPDDARSLADALVEAVNRPEERLRRGVNAREDVAERFTWPALAERVADALDATMLRLGAAATP
jgi:glycosyltransferase involved in cell wall biosynthesis